MGEIEWNDLDELLDKSIGDIREMLAHEDSDNSFKAFLIENGWITDSDDIYDDDDDYDQDEEEDYDDDDEEDEDEDEDDDIELPSDQEDLAQTIARDIDDGKYTVAALSGAYSDDFIARVRQLVE